MQPYINLETTDSYIIREFNENIDPIELMWHRDLEDRTVEVLEGEGWQFQRDNKLPVELKEDFQLNLKKEFVYLYPH